jgi:hypothetical protein
MGYLHIDNLYKNVDVMQFKEVYALEKIHGTSANLRWQKTVIKGDLGEPPHWVPEDDIVRYDLTFFSGGENHNNFVALFDKDALRAKFMELGLDSVNIFGEAYGGKQQGMKATYGDKLRFVAFDVQIGSSWLSVPQAADFCASLGIEFVDYVKVAANLDELNKLRDADSTQAIRNGVGPGKKREGIVIRPPFEVTTNNGKRVIAKHKRDEFKETATPRDVDPNKLQVLEDAKAIASEWVTEMRLSHVLDKLDPPAVSMSDTGRVIKAMIEDVGRESAGEVVWSPEVNKTVGNAAALMFKKRISKI